jgi:hypothetical protein
MKLYTLYETVYFSFEFWILITCMQRSLSFLNRHQTKPKANEPTTDIECCITYVGLVLAPSVLIFVMSRLFG